jgi:hypothetical protein
VVSVSVEGPTPPQLSAISRCRFSGAASRLVTGVKAASSVYDRFCRERSFQIVFLSFVFGVLSTGCFRHKQERNEVIINPSSNLSNFAGR